MKLPSYFKEFLGEIEPSQTYKDNQKAGHTTLRNRLETDEDFKKIHVNTFLQGSYRRNTAIHPGKDVDIVVVTSLDPDTLTAAEANKLLAKCLKKYYENVKQQSRSHCIELKYVMMDVVLATSRQIKKGNALYELLRKADSLDSNGDWADHPLLIPDHDLGEWVDTDPKRQLTWTTSRNTECGGFYVPLVKMFKWWRKETYETPKYPKGYVVERLVDECVDTTKRDHAEGFVQLLEHLNVSYASHAALNQVPFLADRGIPTNSVAHRLTASDFKTFMGKVAAALPTARAALAEEDITKSANLWRALFGAKFPAAPVNKAAFPPVPVRPNKPAGFA